MARAGHQVRNGVDAGAVRDGRSVGDDVGMQDRVHVHEVAHAHGEQVAVREHHALGAAGGTAGVEQPGHVAQVTFDHGYGQRVGSRGQQGVGLGRIQVNLSFQTRQRGGGHIGGDEGPARPAVGGNPFHFAGVQLGVDWHRYQPRPPQPPKHFQVARVVAREQQNPVAGLQPGSAQAFGQRAAACRPLAMGRVQLITVEDRGGFRALARLTRQQLGQDHAGLLWV